MSEDDFVIVHERYSDYVFVGCLLRLGDKSWAQDAAQEVWIAFWESYDERIGPPRPFLTTLITAKSSDVWRQHFRKPSIPASAIDNKPTTPSSLVEGYGDEGTSLFDRLASRPPYHPTEMDPEAWLAHQDFLQQVQAVMDFIGELGDVPTNAVTALLAAGRRVGSIGGGTTGIEAPCVLSSAQRSALRHLRRKLKGRFSYWHDPWGVCCDVSTLERTGT